VALSKFRMSIMADADRSSPNRQSQETVAREADPLQIALN